MPAKLRSALSLLSDADAMVLQSIVGEELAQGPYVAARVGFEPATLLRTQGTEPTTEPPCPTRSITTENTSKCDKPNLVKS